MIALSVYDENGHLLDAYDLEKGYLKHSVNTVHHDAIEGVEEQGHYETIREYPETGGKDVEWVIDIPGVEAVNAWDETIPVYIYVPYTEEELIKIQQEKEEKERTEKIESLKAKLFETDYVVIKIAEGSATFEEYEDIVSQRKAWRKEIQDLGG